MSKRPSGTDKAVLAAIVGALIAGACGIIAAVIGILPDILPGSPAPTPVGAPADSPTTEEEVPAAPTSATAPSAAADINGVWRVSDQNSIGSSLDYWELQLNGQQLSITAFNEAVPGVPLPGDYREPLEVSDVQLTGNTLSFTARRGSMPSVTTYYTLTILSSSRIEGTYRRIDTYLRDTGTGGVIETEGIVILTPPPQ
jgi:hypothetical protein